MGAPKIATPLDDVGWTGNARRYRLSEPVSYGWDDDKSTTQYVIVSAVDAMFSGPETYIFPASEAGRSPLSWGEMEGSFRGALDHAEALRGLGFEIAAAEVAG